jgi:hypothetical protein
MSILSLSHEVLRKIVALSEKREKLLAEVGKVEAEIRDLEASGSGKGVTTRKAAPVKVALGRRGGIKDRVLAELTAAGKEGVTVKDLATRLGLKPQNLHVWFASTGKKLGIRKIGPAQYAL